MNVRSTRRPSLTVSVGRIRPRKSTWPQGCDQYEAKVMSGAEALVGLPDKRQFPPGLVALTTVPVTVIPLATQPAVELNGWLAPGVLRIETTLVSDFTLPAGVTISVSGVSAETDHALPHGPE